MTTAIAPPDVTVSPRDLRFDVAAAQGHWLGGDSVGTAVFNALSLTFPDGERLYLDARGTGSVWSGQRGATLRIRKTAPDSWTALDIVGVWRSG